MGIKFLFYMAFSLLWAEHMEAVVTQSPRKKVTKTGEKVTLNCQQTNSHDYMFWYRQDPGHGLRLIRYSYGTDSHEEGDIPDGYSIHRLSKDNLSLTLGSASPSQTSVYFCATSDGTVLHSCLPYAHKVDLGLLSVGVTEL